MLSSKLEQQQRDQTTTPGNSLLFAKGVWVL